MRRTPYFAFAASYIGPNTLLVFGRHLSNATKTSGQLFKLLAGHIPLINFSIFKAVGFAFQGLHQISRKYNDAAHAAALAPIALSIQASTSART